MARDYDDDFYDDSSFDPDEFDNEDSEEIEDIRQAETLTDIDQLYEMYYDDYYDLEVMEFHGTGDTGAAQ